MKYFLSFAIILSAAIPIKAQLVLNNFPSREVGQISLTVRSGAPNLVEGREVALPQAVAIDRSVTPPILYVADTNNNRVLGWRNATQASAGTRADVAIGQFDLTSTIPLGPNSSFLSGLSAPTGLVVDSSGNLYVGDSGNNRILRFPKPFQQVDQKADRITADFVIGQPDLTTATASTSATTIATFVGGAGAYQTGLAFDSAGNLWFTDPLNNRVLRYPASALKAGQPNGPAADVVLGQNSFDKNIVVGDRQDKSKLGQPSSIAFDSAGRLFVADIANRVLVYVGTPTLVTGQNASRLMGIVPATATNPRPPAISEQTLGQTRTNGTAFPPSGVFVSGNVPYVVDTPNNRILRYDPFDQWPAEATQFSPSAVASYGQSSQTDFANGKTNNGQPEPSASTFSLPTQMTASATEAYIADTNNNRVLVFPMDGAVMRATATRVIGQLDFPYSAVNLIEGRELFLQNGRDNLGLYVGGAVVVDKNSNPPHLYIADTWNNRILGYKDARSVKPGDKADIVIGQPDFFRNQVNYPNNDPNLPRDTGLYLPVGVTVDANGNLLICDYGNGRVLRFPAPFSQQAQHPDIVLGQGNFVQNKKDPDSRTMARPYGIVVDPDGNILVSDSAWNRVLFFRKPSGADFTSGQAAELVFGQPDFFTVSVGTALNRMSSPRGIASDSDSRLYVTDSGNGRVLIFNRAGASAPDVSAALNIPGLSGPLGIFVSYQTGEIWVTNTNANQVLRFPNVNQLIFSTQPDTTISNVSAPLGVSLDLFGDLVIAEGSNRVTFYFPGTLSRDAAAFTQRPLSPGDYAAFFPAGGGARFGTQTVAASSIPYPTQLGDIEVRINDVPVPLAFVSPTQINLLVPNNAPTTGFVSVEVIQVSTGRLLAATQQAMTVATPALFTSNQQGTGQIAATNPDGTINGPGNGVARGAVITLYGAGYGFVQGAPPDGQAAGKALPITLTTRVAIGPNIATVLYSGLSPQFPGLWQINAVVPEATPPGTTAVGVVVGESYFSTDNGNGGRISTTITVKDK